MARGALMYRAHVNLARPDDELFIDRSLSLALHPSETVERMVVRLLAWCRFGQGDLEFTAGLSSTDEPDLWRRDDTGDIAHWVEVGEPAADRLRKAASRSRRLSVLGYGRQARIWWRREGPRIEAMPAVEVLWLNHDVPARLAADLPRQFTWQVMISGDTVYLTDHHDDTVEFSFLPPSD